MDNESLLEFYNYRLFKKLEPMQQAERAAFMSELFGTRWHEVYERISELYPTLRAPNAAVERQAE